MNLHDNSVSELYFRCMLLHSFCPSPLFTAQHYLINYHIINEMLIYLFILKVCYSWLCSQKDFSLRSILWWWTSGKDLILNEFSVKNIKQLLDICSDFCALPSLLLFGTSVSNGGARSLAWGGGKTIYKNKEKWKTMKRENQNLKKEETEVPYYIKYWV